MGSITVLQAFL